LLRDVFSALCVDPQVLDYCKRSCASGIVMSVRAGMPARDDGESGIEVSVLQELTASMKAQDPPASLQPRRRSTSGLELGSLQPVLSWVSSRRWKRSGRASRMAPTSSSDKCISLHTSTMCLHPGWSLRHASSHSIGGHGSSVEAGLGWRCLSD
jgi:hypothetical protein